MTIGYRIPQKYVVMYSPGLSTRSLQGCGEHTHCLVTQIARPDCRKCIIMSAFFRIRPLCLLLLIIFLTNSLWGCHPSRPDSDPGPPEMPVPSHKPHTQRPYEVFGVQYTPIESSKGFQETGIASWYGEPFHGRKTSSGEIYNMHARTAAHRTLPMGTFLSVRNLENDKETVVRINDRGPFAKDRILDLSYHSAREIGMVQSGTAMVEIIALPMDEDLREHAREAHEQYFTGSFTVQVGSYADKNRAKAVQDRLRDFGTDEAFITPAQIAGRTVYRVRIGRFTSLEAAGALQALLARNGYENAIALHMEN